MAVTSGTVYSVASLKDDALVDGLKVALVLFTMSGTYAQADNSQLLAVDQAIEDSRRNGKNVTMRDAMLWQCARSLTDPDVLLGLKTVAVSGADLTFEITLGGGANALDLTTEFTNATALPTQDTPFGVAVLFTEA